jgi:ABC-type phosphate transport system substrate-binding protein
MRMIDSVDERMKALRRNRGRSGGFTFLKLTGRRAVALLSVAVVASALALPAAASANTVLIGSGSSAAQPYMLALFNAYHKIHKTVTFRYNPDGGNAGVKDVQSGISEFGVQTAAPLPSQTHVTFTKFFKDALCIDVNSQNKLSNLTVAQLAGIYKQPPTYTTWSQVGGNLGGLDPHRGTQQRRRPVHVLPERRAQRWRREQLDHAGDFGRPGQGANSEE